MSISSARKFILIFSLGLFFGPLALAEAETKPIQPPLEMGGDAHRPFVVTEIEANAQDFKEPIEITVNTQSLEEDRGLIRSKARINCGEDPGIDMFDADDNYNVVIFTFKSRDDCKKIVGEIEKEIEAKKIVEIRNSKKEGVAEMKVHEQTLDVKEKKEPRKPDPARTLSKFKSMQEIASQKKKFSEKAGTLASKENFLDNPKVIRRLRTLNFITTALHHQFSYEARDYLGSLADKNQDNSELEDDTKVEILLEKYLAEERKSSR